MFQIYRQITNTGHKLREKGILDKLGCFLDPSVFDPTEELYRFTTHQSIGYKGGQ